VNIESKHIVRLNGLCGANFVGRGVIIVHDDGLMEENATMKIKNDQIDSTLIYHIFTHTEQELKVI
jgi:hypothetical protein